MNSEIILTNSNRKLSVTVQGGDNENILTSLPEVNGQFIFLTPDQEVQIACYYEDSVYLFEAEFKGMVTIENHVLYEFYTNSLVITKNRRTEERINTQIPAVITNHQEMIFATILDRSNQGMKIQTKSAIHQKEILIRFEDNGQILTLKGTIIREQKSNNSFLYGLLI